eukprot:Opistho-2@26929
MFALHIEIDEEHSLPNDELVSSISTVEHHWGAKSPTRIDKERRRGKRIFNTIAIETLTVTTKARGSPGGTHTAEGAPLTLPSNIKTAAITTEGRTMWSSVVAQGTRNDGDGDSATSAALPPADNVRSGKRVVGAPPSSSATVAGGSSATETINIISGNPRVELTKGLLHIYRERAVTDAQGPVAGDKLTTACHVRPGQLPPRRSLTACIVAVPSTMEYRDLLQFLAPLIDTIVHIRIVRDGAPNHYMVLARFARQEDADAFYQHYNGRRFNSLEPEVSHVAFVARIEASWSDRFAETGHSQHTTTPVRLVEIPNCPVCLELMDETATGIMTIACNHSVHCRCMSMWGDSSCPICRYRQKTESNQCMDCDTRDDLWICLVCGNIGCGRYRDGHAQSHFGETQHTYAMELDSGRVWDYVGDNYVHRLIQNKADGKLVELPGNSQPRPVAEGNSGFASDEKADALQLEYTYLLTSQLESQRHYFAAEIDRLSMESDCKMADMQRKLDTANTESHAVKERLTSIEKEKKALEKKYVAVTAKATKVEADYAEDRMMFEQVRKNNEEMHKRMEEMETKWKTTVEVKCKEVEELKEQVRDLMFYLETQQKVASSPDRDELQSGQVVIQQQHQPQQQQSPHASSHTHHGDLDGVGERRGSFGKGKGKKK